MRLLSLGLIRLAVEPDGDKDQPASGCDTDTSDPGVSTADNETARPLVVSKVADGDGALLVDVAKERTLVVDNEIEDTVLIGHSEAGAEDGAVGGRRDGLQGQTVEGRQHAEFKLKRISSSRKEGNPTVTIVL